MRANLLIGALVGALAACSGGKGATDQSSPPAPPLVAPVDATPAAVMAPPADAAAPVAAAPPDAAPGCLADATHCCLKDGRIVGLGRCEPVNRGGPPAMTRLPDGRCEPKRCLVRCLPAQARIATPHGEVDVASLAVGDRVWTLAADGRRVAMPILQVASVAAPHHMLSEVRLDDGRVIRASAAHPTHDGRLVGDLVTGDRIDGARVIASVAVPYDGDHTWDLLPAGATGAYWADGVLLGSTLAPALP